GWIRQVLAKALAQSRNSVERIRHPQDERLQTVRITVKRAGKPLSGQPGRTGEPAVLRGIRLPLLLLLAKLIRALVRHVAAQWYALGLDLAREIDQVIARPGRGIAEASAVHHEAALPVQVADERIERHHRIGVVEARAGHHAAVRDGACLAAVAGELVRQAFHDFHGNTTFVRILGDRPRSYAVRQQLEARAHAQRLPLDVDLHVHLQPGFALYRIDRLDIALRVYGQIRILVAKRLGIAD